MAFSHKDIYEMLEKGKFDKVKFLIETNFFDPNAVNFDDDSDDFEADDPVIHLAFFNERYDLVEWLAKQGADINILNPYRASILTFIVNDYGESYNEWHIDFLISLGADPNNFSTIYMPNEGKKNPYERLLEHGFNINNLIRQNSMERAIIGNNFEFFIFLYKNAIIPRNLSFLLHQALLSDNPNFLEFYCQHFPVDLNTILTTYNQDHGSPLQVAINNIDNTRILINYGADVNYTPFGHAPIHVALENGNFPVIQLLLENNAIINNINLQDLLSSTTFTNSAVRNNEIITFLQNLYQDNKEALDLINQWLDNALDLIMELESYENSVIPENDEDQHSREENENSDNNNNTSWMPIHVNTNATNNTNFVNTENHTQTDLSGILFTYSEEGIDRSI